MYGWLTFPQEILIVKIKQLHKQIPTLFISYFQSPGLGFSCWGVEVVRLVLCHFTVIELAVGDYMSLHASFLLFINFHIYFTKMSSPSVVLYFSATCLFSYVPLSSDNLPKPDI